MNLMRYILLISLAIILNMSSCGNKELSSQDSDTMVSILPSDELQEIASEMNSQTPFQSGPTTIQESIKLNYADKMFEYNFIEQNPNINPAEIQRRMDETRVSTLEDQLRVDPGAKDFLGLIVKDGYRIRIRFVLTATNDTLQKEVSNDEIAELLN